MWSVSGHIRSDIEKIGRDDRIRTYDPHTPSVMRYQAALRPDRRRTGLTRLYG